MSDAKAGREAREHMRAPIELKVEYKKMNTFFSDYTKNISKGGTFIKTQGRDELAKLARGGRRGPMNVRNMSSLAIIEPSPEGATGIQYAEAINFGERDKKTPTDMDHFLWYEDVYVKTPDGWRFKSRAIHGENGALKKPFVPPATASAAPTPLR